MKILNYGSINYDRVYRLDSIAKPEETVQAEDVRYYFGGKGLNQSVALTRAGMEVFHAGIVGPDARPIRTLFDKEKIDHRYVTLGEHPTGHAVIQIDNSGENSIIVAPGANAENSQEKIDHVFDFFDKGDVLLLQNEMNMLPELIDAGYKRGMTVVLNPSPFNVKLNKCDFSKVTYLIMNENEGEAITGKDYLMDVVQVMRTKYPDLRCVFTQGSKGATYFDKDTILHCDALNYERVDTTAAGDTFIGYFVASLISNKSIADSLQIACVAAALATTKEGAVSSIPTLSEVQNYLPKSVE